MNITLGTSSFNRAYNPALSWNLSLWWSKSVL